MPSKYYALLDEFIELNNLLVSNGQAYLTVILSHELYRFLYPYEPYENFTNSNPVEFIKHHLENLLELLIKFSKTIAPYDNRMIDSCYKPNDSVEMATSNLYTSLWNDFNIETITNESYDLIKQRLPQDLIENNIIGKSVLDMGCGSGRYSIALAKAGAKNVIGIDLQAESFELAQKWCIENNVEVKFQEGNVLSMSFADNHFDFIFCNGVLHHTDSIRRGLEELSRVLKPYGKAFLYLYGAGGIFWKTRAMLRKIFKQIPLSYTKTILQAIGMPNNRFIFCDTWYVPVETYTTEEQLISFFEEIGLRFRKIIGNSPFDLDKAIASNGPEAREMWGDGEHRYIVWK